MSDTDNENNAADSLSLMDLLRDCLPIHASWSHAEAGWMKTGVVSENASGKPVKLTPPAQAFKRTMLIQAPGTGFQTARPAVPKLGTKSFLEYVETYWGLEEAMKVAPLWEYTFPGGAGDKVNAINCRAREAGYNLQAVIKELAWGHKGEALVKVETTKGEKFDLPLQQKYLYGQFKVTGGFVEEGVRDMWPLEMKFDKGHVLVYLYQPNVDDNGKLTTPLQPFTPKGKGKWKPAKEHQTFSFGKQLPPDIKDKDGWLEAFTGPFTYGNQRAKQTTAKIGTSKTRAVSLPTFVVVVSLGLMCERADFEPGGIVGMAKLFPHIMVTANMPLKKTAGSVKIERVPQGKTEQVADPKFAKTCCNALPDIGAILVTDANEVGGVDSQKPFWGGTFSYYQEDAGTKLAGKDLHVVKKTAVDRTYPGGTRYLVSRPDPPPPLGNPLKSRIFKTTLKGVEKVARQGEFDNIHLAPPLKLDVKTVWKPGVTKWIGLPGATGTALKFDAAKMHFDKIWMAPFCAHDCFHTHWRWARGEKPRWTHGWDERGPHRKSGAPMVPLHQDVYLKMVGVAAYQYHAESEFDDQLDEGQWDIVMHHGAAYAQAIANWLLYQAAHASIGMAKNYKLYDAQDKEVGSKIPGYMYWLFRYIMDDENGEATVSERIAHNPAEMLGARMY